MRGNHKPNFIEVSKFPHVVCKYQMPDMYRIERTRKYTNLLLFHQLNFQQKYKKKSMSITDASIL
ncbi:MAG: hypothetical protein BWZ00_01417 [Bacteroidetes bacterium ADurb.BinA174]|nr:MAG: hypothetical protein BWZ00_01417 [Bacteroidetes bacterium ADurb.BinA174]